MEIIPRVIPTLLIKDGGLVKGVNFKNHKYVGDPINAVKIYNEKEVDELCLLNISSNNKKGIPYDFIENIAAEAFMPFSYGGNITNLEQIKTLIGLGVEKIILNSIVHEDKELILQAADYIGSSSVVVSVDYKRSLFGKDRVYISKKNRLSQRTVLEFCKEVQSLGAGEILLCSVDREGTNRGYDLKSIKKISGELDIPLVASGGASKLDDFKMALENGASAVAAGNLFIFRGKYKAVMISYPKHKELKELFQEA